MRSLGRETNEELSFKLQCCLRNVFVLDSNGGSIMPSYSVGYSLRYGVCRAKKILPGSSHMMKVLQNSYCPIHQDLKIRISRIFISPHAGRSDNNRNASPRESKKLPDRSPIRDL